MTHTERSPRWRRLGSRALWLLIVLSIAAGLRLTGLDWGELEFQHPDENHLVSVLGSLKPRACADGVTPVDVCPEAGKRWLGLGEYLDTRSSTLNPYNTGFSFYVYGNLPMTLVRVAAENFPAVNLRALGRRAAALADLCSILLLYLIASRLYGYRVGLLAGLLSALTVLQIQQSHFFTTDLFVNAFALAAVYFAVAIAAPAERPLRPAVLSIAFGIAYGMAMASKISILPLALLLPAAFTLRTPRDWRLAIGCLALGGLAALVTFRVCQPYAFVGLSLNPQWVGNILEQRAQASGEADMPWNLQWARRSHLYSFTNLTIWGLGLPLGIAAWAGFLFMGWRIAKGETRHALLWGWTAAYFTWQSLQFNATMRYQLPIYPMLAIMAAWMLVHAARWRRGAGVALAAAVIVLTAGWAVAFQSIYLREEPRMAASRWVFQNVPGAVNLRLRLSDGTTVNQPLSTIRDQRPSRGDTHLFRFAAVRSGTLTEVYLPHARAEPGGGHSLSVTLSNPAQSEVIARGRAAMDGSASDSRGAAVHVQLETGAALTRGSQYALTVSSSEGPVELTGDTFASETDFDYTIPFRVDGYDPFGGIYRGDLNLQVYWDDNADKLQRFVTTLDQADYIFIPTNHQYAQITRLPERYPLTTEYYRELIGCPPGEEIAECYRRARPGMFNERLGFELAAVFESHPRLGPIVIDDQRAEEAFTFFDHPKVLIFRKSRAYSADRVHAALASVDLTRVVRLTPRQFAGFSELMLRDDTLAAQRAGGTWHDLFHYSSLLNRRPIVAAVVWYLFITIVGLAAYPIVRLAFRTLPDHGYPLSRAVGLLMLGYGSWLAGSGGLSYSRSTIAAALLVMMVGGGLATRHQRASLVEEWRSRRRYFVAVELLTVVLFAAFLLLRLGNPDLWHPSMGGERPMDFSYLNAVIKSTTFPPFDPWFAGGYINYYYFGFVMAGTPIKLLGIVPSVGYNLMIPTLFALVGTCAFSLGWNLQAHAGAARWRSFAGGLAAAAFTVLLGNAGTLRLIAQWLRGGNVRAGDWYWTPSRLIPAGPGHEITEFPLFTFIYGDLHAHMLALPLALLALSCACAAVTMRGVPWRRSDLAGFGLAALIAGALSPANLADGYTYLAILAAAVVWTWWRPGYRPIARQLALAACAAIILVALSFVLYRPYHQSYAQAYGALDVWRGPFTSVSSYLTHWMVLLLPILWWMASETRDWFRSAKDPRTGWGQRRLVLASVATTVLIAILLASHGVIIGWIALPLVAWAALLMVRPSCPDAKRFVLLLTAAALAVTVAVEVVAVRGDIGRQNTVFKFYLQAWMLLAISAGAAVAWTAESIRRWSGAWRYAWRATVAVAISIGALFTVTATAAKWRDRWAPNAPHTLDGMTYMNYVRHEDFNVRMDLAEDYRAIRWMQDNVQGSPVIVEAHCSEYRWCTRFTVYTGLPGVVGWNFHQRQQRMLLSDRVTKRVEAIGAFYNTADPADAVSFLDKYGVRYIVVGQLERAQYAPAGIAKFEALDGLSWRAVYRDRNTVIYETIE